MERNDFDRRMEAVSDLSEAQQKEFACTLLGHSRIVTMCFGYVYCARCEAQIGDTLGGASDAKQNVIVGHACDTCKANFEKCDWRDAVLAPNPFDPEKVKEQQDARDALAAFRAERSA